MNPFDIAALLVVLAAALGFCNYHFLKLPHTIGLTVMGAVVSLGVLAFDAVFPAMGLGGSVHSFIANIDFHAALMDSMLSFLLFAGALHVDLQQLLSRRWAVLAMATIGVLVSTAVVGFGFYALTMALGVSLPLIWCLVFGALISPTDPVAVLGILKTANVPPSLEGKVAGESLFNDGVGVVVFSILLAIATGSEAFSVTHAVELFVIEALGGALFGLIIGWIAFQAMRTIDEHNLELLITLALVMGGYAAAHQLHVSGPLAMAIAGLLIGNHGTAYAMSDDTAERLHTFWSLLDEVLNSILFLLIGIEVLVVSPRPEVIALGLIAIFLVLVARATAVGVPFIILGRIRPFTRGAYPVLVWGGLRGGISIALALSLPEGAVKDVVVAVTYVVVVFSVVVQGTTVGATARRFVREE
ncbi:MAG: sodium:proton antiporter [Alphaproteobacteria bacterium]|jgi:CPA1 family monovalent cation:H+ antiporter|nr:sodium:proton antiporter [Alphaproteobacteria bacterium]HJN21500.1 sodium:proton antiporter [Alphaproteobacteria bacterium]